MDGWPAVGREGLETLTRRGLLASTATALIATRLQVSDLALAQASSGGGLTATQRATYRSAVEAVALLPDVAVDASRSEYALQFFEQQLEIAPEHVRAGLAAALDLVDDAAPSGFSAMSPSERLELLHDLAGPSGPDPALEPNRVTERTAVAVVAARAAEPFYGELFDSRMLPISL